ncbi:hypothetical protein [Streptomyces sp. NPDC091371]|uniref:hypothetical protein n=1 Tax=Streptomyces sp. NPDC091371 TaxID=3155303 RepID=UPI0034221948
MVFGRKKRAAEPPVEPVGWKNVHTFVVGTVERPLTLKRKTVVSGPRAIRVPQDAEELRVFAPCAYVGSGPALSLYEDPEEQRLLCSVDAPHEIDGERHHTVRDTDGNAIGTIRRIPPRRPFRHTWRIDQPGHPEIVGRNELVSGDSKAEVVGRTALKVAMAFADSAMSMGAEGGDTPTRPRTLEWRSAEKTVMISLGSAEVTVQASWLDRRLAFAFALVGDR